MTKVRIALNFEEQIRSLSTLEIPIEIRRMDLALVYRGVLTETLDLNEGSYFVSSILPNGRLIAHAEVISGETTFVFSPDPDDQANELPPVEFESTLKNPHANLLSRYLARGYLREAVILAKSGSFFEHRDQTWVTLALYTLLRANELEDLKRMLDWPRNGESSDMIAIRGERLARLGRHDEAFKAFLKLEFSSIPDFPDGVFYATQRLKIYRDVLPMESLETEIRAYTILRRLQRNIPQSQVTVEKTYDVLPLSIGLETLGGVFTKIFERNTPLPATHSEIFSTAEDNQTAVEVQVFQGERPTAADNRLLGKFRLGGIAPQPRGLPQIEVLFHIDTRGVMTVSATDLATGHVEETAFTGVANLSIEELRRQIQETVSEITIAMDTIKDFEGEAAEATASEAVDAEFEADAEG